MITIHEVLTRCSRTRAYVNLPHGFFFKTARSPRYHRPPLYHHHYHHSPVSHYHVADKSVPVMSSLSSQSSLIFITKRLINQPLSSPNLHNHHHHHPTSFPGRFSLTLEVESPKPVKAPWRRGCIIIIIIIFVTSSFSR